MREMTLSEVKETELHLLLSLDRFCREKKLTYYLADGTLLGAVRHQGFIPWDDDIDVQMPRTDYNRLAVEFNEWEEKPEYYRLISPYDPNSCHSIIKIIDSRTVKKENDVNYVTPLGVDIDVFALDGMPDDEKKWLTWYQKLIRTYEDHVLLVSRKPVRLKSRIKRALLLAEMLLRYHKIDKNSVLDHAGRLHALYPWGECVYGGKVECAFNSKKNRLKTEWFGTGIEVDFEGHKLMAPSNYDAVLKGLYRDYMTLPPKEKQITHHASEEYWID